VTIDGRRALVVDRRPPLPPTLDVLLGRLVLATRYPVKVAGARAVCESEQDHRLELFAEGRHIGHDGIARDLRISMCIDCESVCVRDVSRDTIARLPTGRHPLRRRNHVLGWYTGARRNQRQYR
jgi:hypothetical protein